MYGDGILRIMIALRETLGAALELMLGSHLMKAQHLVSFGSLVMKHFLSVSN